MAEDWIPRAGGHRGAIGLHHTKASDPINHRVAALRLCVSLTRHGLDAPRLLADAGISALLAQEPAARLSTPQMVALLKVARLALNDDLYGFGARALKPGTIHYMFELGLRCETLEVLIAHCARFVAQLVPDLSVDLVCEPSGNAGMRIGLTQPACDPDHFLRDQLLLYWYRVLSWAVGYPIPVARLDVCVDEEPSPERLCYWVCRTWRARQPCAGFYFDSRYLSLPVVRTPIEWQQFMEQANGLPELPAGAQALGVRLMGLWRAELKQTRPLPSLEQAAARLGVGPRTLRRQLAREGTSYQQSLDQLLRETAIEMLHVQRLGLADVAEQLGFAEPRSFSRAFKRWTGVPPSRYTRPGG